MQSRLCVCGRLKTSKLPPEKEQEELVAFYQATPTGNDDDEVSSMKKVGFEC